MKEIDMKELISIAKIFGLDLNEDDLAELEEILQELGDLFADVPELKKDEVTEDEDEYVRFEIDGTEIIQISECMYQVGEKIFLDITEEFDEMAKKIEENIFNETMKKMEESVIPMRHRNCNHNCEHGYGEGRVGKKPSWLKS